MPKQAEGRKEVYAITACARVPLLEKFQFPSESFLLLLLLLLLLLPTSDDFLAPLSLSLSLSQTRFLSPHETLQIHTRARRAEQTAERGEGGRAVSSHVYVV